MRDVVFYDFDFNRLGDFPEFSSFNLEKKYLGYGSAELHYSLKNHEIIELLEENPYVFFVAGDMSAVVTGWRVDEDIAVFGRTPEWLLTKRGVRAFEKTGKTAEEIAREAVIDSASDFVTLGELANVETKMDYLTDKVRVLYDVVCEVLKTQGLGFRLDLDIENKQFVFSVYEGKESLCLVSVSNRTAYDMKYTAEKQDMVTNSGWYEQKYTDMGDWDAYNNSPSLLDNDKLNAYKFYQIASETYYQSGGKYYQVERFGLGCTKGYYLYCDSESGAWKVTPERPDTIWVYLNNSKESGAKKWDAVLSGTKTKPEALAEISELKRINQTDSETKGIVFGNDYGLGDIVDVQLEFGDFRKSEKKRVTAVNIYYDTDGSGTVPILEDLEE